MPDRRALRQALARTLTAVVVAAFVVGGLPAIPAAAGAPIRTEAREVRTSVERERTVELPITACTLRSTGAASTTRP